MKTIAMYLPQFHRVAENDAWWGEGFTDWSAMNRAKPLFDGHKQPKKPLNNYQYDLLEKETFLWQEQLMRAHGVYGFCFYHYWFKDGRRILEKPAENLLRWKEIQIPFCFSWANESWGRSWSNISNQNVWASAFEPKENRKGDGILLEQAYGNEEDWTEHFHYLLPFFQDPRYIKKGSQPVMLIYQQEDIPCMKEMCKVWNKLAKQNGFDGIYIIGNYCGALANKYVDAVLVTEPRTTIDWVFPARFTNKSRTEIARYLPYEDVCRESLKWNAPLDGKIYYGGFSNYDDTPRRGSGGTVVYNDTPEKFKIYLADLYAKNKACGNEFVFINAWNEWGEGMHLEPDEEFKNGFLEGIEYAQKHYSEELYKYISVSEEREVDVRGKQLARYQQEVGVLDQWMLLEERGRPLVQWLSENHFHRVGIYGYGVLGRHLVTQLSQGQLEYLCCIDRNADGINLSLPVFSPDDFPELDLVVVTNVHIFDEIKEVLCHRVNRIMSLEYLIECVLAE